jgi:hypothetical protein
VREDSLLDSEHVAKMLGAGVVVVIRHLDASVPGQAAHDSSHVVITATGR